MDEPRNHYAESKKPNRKGRVLYGPTYMQRPEQAIPQIESRLVVVRVGGEGSWSDCLTLVITRALKHFPQTVAAALFILLLDLEGKELASGTAGKTFCSAIYGPKVAWGCNKLKVYIWDLS